MRTAEKHPRHENRGQAFARVEQQSRTPKRWGFTGHVRSANVAAAAGTYIFAGENPHQQVAKRDGSQQVADSGGYEVRIHVSFVESRASSPGPRQIWTIKMIDLLAQRKLLQLPIFRSPRRKLALIKNKLACHHTAEIKFTQCSKPLFEYREHFGWTVALLWFR